MEKYDVIIENIDSTVVSKYESKFERMTEYQSESELEKSLINQLVSQGYEYIDIHRTDDLLINLRKQLERLNNYKFSEKEWKQILDNYLINKNEGIVEKTRKVQEDYIYSLTKDDGSTQNIRIIDKTNIHNNYLQVINQFEIEGIRKNRYDVTILVNGLPLIHIELKRRGVSIKEAFNQITRYHHESFWAESGLFEYVQIYVISNGTHSKYYSNTTREQASKENSKSPSNKRKTSHSFEFTSYWADAENNTIKELRDFTATFFSKHTILNIITRYCVFTVDNLLLVMRPYQIVATERIINRVNIALNDKKRIGTIRAGGYVWHTTGSGKTLTSFKAARIISENPDIKKVLFVVDRKDLDYQTMKEYDKFERGAANSNTSTSVLKKQLESPDNKIIITTIQKLSIFISKNKDHPIYKENVVLIFDECHRSQFGEMHLAITKSFKKYFIFGFTGTPIFAVNTTTHNKFPMLKTTEQVFGDQLHTYTIVDAIRDGNVLPFRIDYINTVKEKENIKDEEVYDIQREQALLKKERIKDITSYILEHFNQKTKRQERSYDFNKLINIADVAKRRGKVDEIKRETQLTGFNSIFAVASIKAARKYYEEFKIQQAKLPPEQRIKVALIYSWSPNEGSEYVQDGLFDENNESTEGLDKSSRDFLEEAIKDYNEYFGTSYDTSSEKFQNYYKDLSLRVKNREVDLLIVVNMFLTGFDATTLNTLWVDKNLRYHGLIQAFSRTNRILNSIKTFGNIVCFRNLEKQVNDAIAVFGNKNAKGIVLLKSFNDYYYGTNDFIGYKVLIEKLLSEFPINKQIIGEKAEKDFIKLYNLILKTKNILQAFDDFKGKEILSSFDFQDYQSIYIDLYDKYRKKVKGDVVSIEDDLVFELELVKSVEVNIDYILMLVAKYQEDNMQDKEIVVQISKAIDSSPTLRNKKDLIMKFIETINVESDVVDDWRSYIEKAKEAELANIIKEENLNEKETIYFVDQSFKVGEIKRYGSDIVKILPPLPMFGKENAANRERMKENVINRLQEFFERYFGL
ncbi:MAG: type I restriction endonuclease subunit R [Bacilli bacterium]